MWVSIVLTLFLVTPPEVSPTPTQTPSAQVSQDTTSLVALYDGGEIEVAELEAWLAFRPPRSEVRAAHRRRIEQLVLLELLEKRYGQTTTSRADAASGEDATFAAWRGVLERRLLGERLQGWIRQQSRPADTEVERAYRAEPERFDQLRLWRLQNLLRSYPEGADGAQRQALVVEVEALKQRIADGQVTFGAAARQFSESSTRRRGGNLGTVSLDRLHPAVADAVAELAPGELSSPIDIGEGVVLIRCQDILEPKELSAEESRERHLQRLWKTALDDQRDAYRERRRRDDPPTFRSSSLDVGGDPETVVLRWSDGTSVSLRSLEYFARDSNRVWTVPMAAERVEALLDGLQDSVAQARAARRLGLGDSAAHYQRLVWETRLLKAELALEPDYAERSQAPSDERFRKVFKRIEDRLKTQPTVELEVLALPIRAQEIPKRIYDRFRALPEALREGLPFEEATRQLTPWVAHQSWGRESESALWRRGLDLEVGVAELAVGEVSGVLQEGQELFIVRLVERQAARPLTFEEARPKLDAMIRRSDREKLRSTLRSELIAGSHLQLMEGY